MKPPKRIQRTKYSLNEYKNFLDENEYDPTIGRFRVKQARSRCAVGDIASFHARIVDTGERAIHVNVGKEKRRVVPLARMVWLVHHKELDANFVVSFKDGDKENTRIENLILVPSRRGHGGILGKPKKVEREYNDERMSDDEIDPLYSVFRTENANEISYHVRIELNGQTFDIGKFNKLSEALQARENWLIEKLRWRKTVVNGVVVDR